MITRMPPVAMVPTPEPGWAPTKVGPGMAAVPIRGAPTARMTAACFPHALPVGNIPRAPDEGGQE